MFSQKRSFSVQMCCWDAYVKGSHLLALAFLIRLAVSVGKHSVLVFCIFRARSALRLCNAKS